MQNKTMIVHISHEFIHYTLFSVNCYSVLLSTLAQAFWIEHYEEIKKTVHFTHFLQQDLHQKSYTGCWYIIYWTILSLLWHNIYLYFFLSRKRTSPNGGPGSRHRELKKDFAPLDTQVGTRSDDSDIIIFDRDDKDISSSFSLL